MIRISLFFFSLMVFLKRSGSEFNAPATLFPKIEERESGQLNKRSKLSNAGENVLDILPSQYNPLNEPSPLGLRLKKSPSLLDLIQTRLSQANGSSSAPNVPTVTSSSAPNVPTVTSKPKEKKIVKGTTSSTAMEKLKASNFPAMLLRIGGWEFVSIFDGDLVAKCYFAKHKLVWEILQNSLKSKIEIQWADITALKVNLPNDGPGTLSITLGKPPHFFKEINPQPRKHTLWQASSDFTDGKASIIRQHILQCPPGVLNKHYEKLIQCDTHLNFVSQLADVSNQSPFFEERVPFFKNPNAPTVQELDSLNTSKIFPVSALQDVSSPSSSFNFEEQNSVGFTPENVSISALSPSSVMDLRASDVSSNQREGSQPQENWDQRSNSLGINRSKSMQDFFNQLDQCISERTCSKEALEGHDMLEDIAHFLFNDNPSASNSDEKKLMSRVNSLCCLLQDPSTGQNLETEAKLEGLIQTEKQPMGMSKKDSFSDLLLTLPRIASLPKFLFDISEDDGDNQVK